MVQYGQIRWWQRFLKNALIAFLGRVCICIAVDYPITTSAWLSTLGRWREHLTNFCHCPSTKHIVIASGDVCCAKWPTQRPWKRCRLLGVDVVNLRVKTGPNKSRKETYFIQYLDKYFISDQQKTHKWCIRIFHDFSVQRKNPNIYTVWVYMYMGIFKVQVIYKGQSCVT